MLRLCLRLITATDAVAAATAASATDFGLYVILAVTVFPAGAPLAGAVGTALYAEISSVRGLRNGLAVATAKRAKKAIVDFILAESVVLIAEKIILKKRRLKARVNLILSGEICRCEALYTFFTAHSQLIILSGCSISS